MSNRPHIIKKGEKIAQLILRKMEEFESEEIKKEDLPNTDRGAKGFGSSDVKK